MSLKASPKLVGKRPHYASRGEEPTARHNLEPRQLKILTLVCDGRTDKEIAAELAISPQTVKNQLYRLRHVTGHMNRVQLARWWWDLTN